MNIARELAQNLLKIKAVKLSPEDPFTWASGMRSPIYCDNRVTLSFPKVRTLIQNAFVEQSKSFEDIDIIIGVATAGIPHGALLAQALDLPFAYVRSKAKAHGRQNLIEGLVSNGQRALVIEDLFSTGGSALQAVQALRDLEIDVLAVGAIFTYQFQLAKTNFEEANCPFFTISNYSVLLEEAEKIEYITKQQKSILQDWSLDPQSWHSKNFT